MRVIGRPLTLVATAAAGLAFGAAATQASNTLLIAGEGTSGTVESLALDPDGTPVPMINGVRSNLGLSGAKVRRPIFAADAQSAWVSSSSAGIRVLRPAHLGWSTREAGSFGPIRLALAATPDGRFGIGGDGNDVVAFHLDGPSAGTVTGRVTYQFADGFAVSPDGRFLFLGNTREQQGRFSTFAIGDDGSLTAVAETRGPRTGRLAVAPDGRTVYGAGTFGGPSWFRVAADGSLVAQAWVDVPRTHISAKDVVVSPDGRFVYTFDSHEVHAYRLEADGRPVYLASAAVGSGWSMDSFAIAPSGRTIYATHHSSKGLAVFDIGADGAPTLRRPVVEHRVWSPEPYDALAVSPDQAPVASFAASPAPAGLPTTFDASASYDPDGQVARYDWDLGDGTILADHGPQVSHVYGTPGARTVRLTVTDAVGTSTERVFTGRQVVRNGGPGAAQQQTVEVPHAHGNPPAPEAPPPAIPPAPSAPPPSPVVSVPPASGARPAVRQVRVTRNRITFRTSSVKQVRATVRRQSQAGKRRTWRTVATRSIRPKGRNPSILKLRLRPGVYRIALRLTGTSGRSTTVRVGRTVR